jgi:hypothetical protein
MRAFEQVPAGVRAVLVVAASSLLMVLVAWATLIGPDRVFTGPGPRPATVTTTAESCLPAPAPGEEAPVNPGNLPYCEDPDTSRQDAEDLVRQADPPLWLKLIVWTLEVVLLLAVLALVAFLLLQAGRLVRHRLRPQGARDVVEFIPLDEPARIAAAVTEDAVEQDTLLRQGEPRNAIVEAWLRFEVQGERAGVGRRPWETSSEYAIRILDLAAADAGAVYRLAVLFREARFSEHPITEEHRRLALEALADIRRSLGVRS